MILIFGFTTKKLVNPSHIESINVFIKIANQADETIKHKGHHPVAFVLYINTI